MARTNENYLRWKFGRCVVKGYTSNVTLIAPSQETAVALEAGESPIAWVALAVESEPLLFTDLRMIRHGQTFVRFDDVAACFWIDRNKKLDRKLKSERFHRLILELHDGTEVVIDGLEEAAFPVLSFFWHQLGRYCE